MKRYELYIDNNMKLALSEFDDINLEFESRIIKGSDIYGFIRSLASSKAIDVIENEKNNEVLIKYKNYVVNINDFNEIGKKSGVAPLIRSTKNYYEQKALKSVKGQRVKRSSKNIGKRIIAVATTVAILGVTSSAIALGSNANVNEHDSVSPNYSFSSFETKTHQKADIALKDNMPAENKTLPQKADVSVDKDKISLNYEDRSEEEKVYIVKANYSELISKYSKMYGIDANLITAIATQESWSGVHTTTTDPGGATGLMQIQNEVWIGNEISAYNFETREEEEFTVTLEKLQDVEYNIKIGCMIFQECLCAMNYNVLAAIQCYNMGRGNMTTILDEYSNDSGKSLEEILNDTSDTKWMDYRNIISVGDQEYIENVLSWAGNDLKIRAIKETGDLVSLNVANLKNNIKKY